MEDKKNEIYEEFEVGENSQSMDLKTKKRQKKNSILKKVLFSGLVIVAIIGFTFFFLGENLSFAEPSKKSKESLAEPRKNKPVLLVIMDGVGISQTHLGDAVTAAKTPNLNGLLQKYPHITLKAHGEAVGLPSDEDMGNSEVGHNALGCGQIYAQGAKLVSQSIETGTIFTSDSWKEVIKNVKDHDTTLHFIGLLSDGNVHSHITHLFRMIEEAKKEGVRNVRIHTLMDGRDTPATSGLIYIDQLEDFLKKVNDDKFYGAIASGGGRMKITMDRYESNWKMVEDGWNTHVAGEGRQFNSAREAIEEYRRTIKDLSDQFLPPFIIAKDGKPLGRMVDNDSVIFFNFRGDRAIEISMLFEDPNLKQVTRKYIPKLMYAGLLEYESEKHIPRRFLVPRADIKFTLTDLLNEKKMTQCAISETQKYGHVTYFWNGNRMGVLDDKLEKFIEIPSDDVPFNEKPKMKAIEITDETIKALKSKKYDFIRINYPNGDMVGHTGDFDATVIGISTVDLCLGKIVNAAKENGYSLIVTADHGNADEMLEKNKKGEISVRTAHSLNPVPFIIVDDDVKYTFKKGEFGLANVTPTIAQMLGIKPYDCWVPSLIE